MNSSLTSFLPTQTAHIPAAASRDVSDEALIIRIARRDSLAFEMLMQRHKVRVYRFVLRLVHDRSLAEDLVRDTFFEVWRRADRFENRCLVSTWIMAIARYKSLSARERPYAPNVPLEGVVAATLVDPKDNPDAAMERKDTAHFLRQCLGALPAEQAMIIDLVYYHEKSVKEVATIAGIPENTVKSRMFLARKKLAQLLAAAGVDTTSLAVNRSAA